jgi:hypothetical protein
VVDCLECLRHGARAARGSHVADLEGNHHLSRCSVDPERPLGGRCGPSTPQSSAYVRWPSGRLQARRMHRRLVTGTTHWPSRPSPPRPGRHVLRHLAQSGTHQRAESAERALAGWN